MAIAKKYTSMKWFEHRKWQKEITRKIRLREYAIEALPGSKSSDQNGSHALTCLSSLTTPRIQILTCLPRTDDLKEECSKEDEELFPEERHVWTDHPPKPGFFPSFSLSCPSISSIYPRPSRVPETTAH
eukprot:783276-Rhodomonas_salina.3